LITRRSIAILALGAVALVAQSSDEIRAILVKRIDQDKKGVAIAVGVLDDAGQRIAGYGKLSNDNPQVPDGDTVFEIGSITKVFTSLLLADMIERGAVKADDPVEKYLPDTVKVPSRNGRKITLLDISTQHSGLPRMPTNFRPADFANPYADYDPAKLYDFLSHYELPRDPGEKYEYSNLAVGTLGLALARRAGMSYEELVKSRVLVPLKMSSTSITLSADQKKRLAIGHNALLQPVKNWDLNALEGAGALRSTVNDMLKFLSAASGRTNTPLAPAFRRMLTVRRDTAGPEVKVAMGWHILTAHDAEIVWHNGGTGGYRTWAGYTPANKKCVVVLTNTSQGADDIGQHLTVSAYPLAEK
jgi:CubicO group peptidase (beta-lactamase class C family)